MHQKANQLMGSTFRHTVLLILICVGCALSGCATVPRVTTSLFEGRQGAISLRVFAEPRQRAQHPIGLEPQIIREVLEGLYIQDTQTILASALTNDHPPIQAFTQEEIHFLTPHVIAGLAKATPEEEIVFQLQSSQSPNIHYTPGSLYYSDSTVHVIIDGYHKPSKRPPILSRPSSSFARPKMWKMSFQPTRALANDQVDLASQTSFPFHFAIDLPTLAQTLKNNAHPISPQSPSIQKELEGLRESLQQQHRKIERLEDQLQTDSPTQP